MSRPKDLKRPFHWSERRVLVHEKVWYVPDQYTDFNSFLFPGWQHPSLFEISQPVCIEYCSGNGDWVTQKAFERPNRNWVAIERKFDRVRKIWSKMKNKGLQNVLPVCGEGYRITKEYIPTESVEEIYINFPDPWPKNRHIKHRLIQTPFGEEILRILKPEGTLMIVTDDPQCRDWAILILSNICGFIPQYAEPHYVNSYPGYGTSYFENMWREKEKCIYYILFKKFIQG